jgi:hypothetical protein
MELFYFLREVTPLPSRLLLPPPCPSPQSTRFPYPATLSLPPTGGRVVRHEDGGRDVRRCSLPSCCCHVGLHIGCHVVVVLLLSLIPASVVNAPPPLPPPPPNHRRAAAVAITAAAVAVAIAFAAASPSPLPCCHCHCHRHCVNNRDLSSRLPPFFFDFFPNTSES